MDIERPETEDIWSDVRRMFGHRCPGFVVDDSLDSLECGRLFSCRRAGIKDISFTQTLLHVVSSMSRKKCFSCRIPAVRLAFSLQITSGRPLVLRRICWLRIRGARESV
jgi:hypothetical protein